MRSLMLAVIALLLAARIEAATVLVFSNPKGATVQIGDESKTTPVRLTLSKGKHALTFSKEGYEQLAKEVEVGDRLLRVSVKLEKKKYPVDVVFEDITETDWHVFADGKLLTINNIAILVPATIKLPLGKTRITVMKDGFVDQTKTVTVTEESQVVEFGKAKSGSSSLSRLPWLKYVGTWVKDSGTALTVNPDMTYWLDFNAGAPWEDSGGKIVITKDGFALSKRHKSRRFVYEAAVDRLRCPKESDWTLNRKKLKQ